MVKLYIDKNTVFKKRSIQSSELSDSEKVNIAAGESLELVSFQLDGEHYLVELKNGIEPIGDVGFIYFRHAHLEGLPINDSARKLVNLVLSDQWASIKSEAIRIVGSSENTCVAFASEALRRIGFSVPAGMAVTKPFGKHLVSMGCANVPNAKDLIPGDLCFTKDHTSFPTFPAHVYIFIEWIEEDSTSFAHVVDNQGEIHIRNVMRTGPRTPFKYALRLP